MEVTRTEPFENDDARAWRSGRDRLAALYESQGAAATRLAYLLSGDAHAAQDIAHEAFVKIGKRVFRLRDAEHERAYLFRTVVNTARGRGRRLGRERRALARGERDPIRYVEPPDTGARDEMWGALLELPLRQRAALFLRYYEDLSEAQAAAALECSIPAVKSLVNRGLRDLRARLEGGRDE